IIATQPSPWCGYLHDRIDGLMRDLESLNLSNDNNIKLYVDKCITDINDHKADYLKRYLEVQTHNISLSLSQMLTTQNDMLERLRKLEDINA
ncbi:MAG: hypothetical protein AAB649_07715, partial [Patescibacteria group bacterium]